MIGWSTRGSSGYLWHHNPTSWQSVNWIEIKNEKDYEGMIGRLRGGDIDAVKSESQSANWITSFIWQTISHLINDKHDLSTGRSISPLRVTDFDAREETLNKMLLLPLEHNYICTSNPSWTNTIDALHNSDNCTTKNSLYLCNQQDVAWWNIYSSGSTKHWPTKRKLLQIIQTALSELASATVNYFMPMQVPVCGNPFGQLHQSCAWDGKCVIQPEGADIWITFIIYEHI